MENLIKNQQTFFQSGQTKDINFRLKQLKLLKKILLENEKALCDAIFLDFSKSSFETYINELGILYTELNEAINKLKLWSTPRKVSSSWLNLPSSNYIYPEPLGNTLVISAWNYPYQLSLAPCIAAIAAGNTIVLKSSEIAPNTSQILYQLISENFDPNYFAVVQGGVTETTNLLNLPFHKIFFTGSTAVGKIVYQAAAKQLIPVTLELGGKSPAIFTENANLKLSIQRLVCGKFLNAGQTCVAPDFVLIPKKLETQFIQLLITEIKLRNYQIKNGNFTQIINQNHTKRIVNLYQNENIIFGGNFNIEEKFIEPTLILNPTWESQIMQNEIFGPILPIITYENLNETILKLNKMPKPLASYFFSNNKKETKKFLQNYSFGGGCVNETLMHLVNSNLGFGGVGASGIGAYHGFEGFKTFSHLKSILYKPTWFELPIRYYPYTKLKLKLLKTIFEKF